LKMGGLVKRFVVSNTKNRDVRGIGARSPI